MQPLALQPLSSSIDAGDPSNNSTPNPGANSSVAFNDLMSEAAADQRRVSDAAQADARSAEEDKSATAEKDAENSVAALTAAAQFASRNVKLKQRAAAVEQSRAEIASRAARDRAHSHKRLPVGKEEPTPPQDEKSTNQTGEQTDAAMAAEASATTPKHIPEDNEKSSESSPVDLLTDPAEKAAKTTTGDIAASSPAAQGVADQTAAVTTRSTIQKLTAPKVKNEKIAQIELEKSPSNSGGDKGDGIATAPGQIDSKDAHAAASKTTAPASTDLLSKSDPDKSNSLLKPDPVTDANTSQVKTDAADDHTQHGTDPAMAGNQQFQTQDNAAVANLTPSQAPLSAPPRADDADPLLAQRRSQTPDQIPALNQQSTNLLTAAAPQVTTPEGATKLAWMNTTENSQLPGKTKASKEAAAADLTELPLTAAPEETQSPQAGSGSLQQKMTDQQLANAMQAKNDGEPNQHQRAELGKETVSLEELAKLGAKNITTSSEPKTSLTTSSQDTAPLTAPPPAAATATPSQAQTTATATASSETNGERRSIAADIRLRAMERMVVAAARAGAQNLTLQLYPPGLGQIMIRLVMDGQRLRIVTRAANAEAVNTLKGMEEDLRQALSGNGLNLTDFDVNDDPHDEEQARRQSTTEPATKTSSGGKNDSFTIDMNA